MDANTQADMLLFKGVDVYDMYIEVDSRDMAEIRSLVKGWYPHPVTMLVCGFKGKKELPTCF